VTCFQLDDTNEMPAGEGFDLETSLVSSWALCIWLFDCFK